MGVGSWAFGGRGLFLGGLAGFSNGWKNGVCFFQWLENRFWRILWGMTGMQSARGAGAFARSGGPGLGMV